MDGKITIGNGKTMYSIDELEAVKDLLKKEKISGNDENMDALVIQIASLAAALGITPMKAAQDILFGSFKIDKRKMPSLKDFLQKELLLDNFIIVDLGMGLGEVYTEPEHKETVEKWIYNNIWAPFKIDWIDINELNDGDEDE